MNTKVVNVTILAYKISIHNIYIELNFNLLQLVYVDLFFTVTQT